MAEIAECPLFEAFSTIIVSTLEFLEDPYTTSKSTVEWESEFNNAFAMHDSNDDNDNDNDILLPYDDDAYDAFDVFRSLQSNISNSNITTNHNISNSNISNSNITSSNNITNAHNTKPHNNNNNNNNKDRTTIRDIAKGAAKNTTGGGAEDWKGGQSDGEIIQQTLTIYGTFFVFCLLLFCVVRKTCPKPYNLRSGWIRDHDIVEPNPRARHPDGLLEGFVSWLWKVWTVADSELSSECGMDALCLCRVLEWGARLSLMGSLIGCFLLMPVYATADDTTTGIRGLNGISGVEQLNISNVPEGMEGTGYFLATVAAAYLIFGYTMLSMLDEFRWFYQFRYEFLARPIPRNYTVYVRNLSEEYSTARALVDYFSHLEDYGFGGHHNANDNDNANGSDETAALVSHHHHRRHHRNPTKAWVALKIPKLRQLVAKRDDLLAKLEHTINVEDVLRKIPKTTDPNSGHEIALVDALFAELAVLNRDVTAAIERIDRRSKLENPLRDYCPEDYLNPVLLEGSDAGDDDNDHDQNVSYISELTYTTRPKPTRPPQGQHYQIWRKKATADAYYDCKSVDPSLGSSQDSASASAAAAAYLTIPHTIGEDEPDNNHNSNSNSNYDRVGLGVAADDDLTTTSSEVFGNSQHYRYHYHKSNDNENEYDNGNGNGNGTDNRHLESIELEAGEPTSASNNKSQSKRPLIIDKVGKVANYTGAGITTVGKVANQQIKNVGKIANDGIQIVGESAIKGAKKAASLVLNKADDGAPLTAGFVSFSSLKACQVARQVFHSSDAVFGMEVLEAPGAGDVNWSNVGKTHKELQLGLLFSAALTAALCLFWTVVITFISTLSSVEGLTELIPQLKVILEESPWLYDLLAQVSPLMIVVANSLLRVILELLSGLEGHVSGALVQASLFSKLSAFMIIQTFFVNAISGSIISELSEIVKDSSAIVSLLANSLPNRSAFFIQIMLVQTCVTLGPELLRVTPVAIAIARSLVGPKLTEDERRTTWMGLRPLADPLPFYHADILSGIVFYFIVFFVYATLAPITSIFVFLCFLFMGATYRHQFIFVYPTLPDSGGKLWIQFMQIVPVSLIIAEVTIVGFLALKNAPVAYSLMLPLLYVTVLFNVYIRQKHFAVANFLPGCVCVEADSRNNADGPMDMRFLTNQYQQPELRDKEVYPSNASLERQLKHGILSRASEREREREP